MGAIDYENQNDAQRLRAEMQRRQTEETQRTAESLSVKERIQRRRSNEEAVEEEFYGETLEFDKPGLRLQKRAMSFAAETEGQDEDEINPETTTEIVDFMVEGLAELATDADLDEEFWGGFGFSELEPLMDTVLLAGEEIDGETLPEDLDAEEVDGFREE